ncbi:FprA family A-type flavoprotein [Paenibacillus sp. HN-1]|uniref:FprA family A-type flavoprotein n=1 Tax=Paenibacillus TaxID=44249 RepID=UPI001CA91764|nr:MULTISPECIES: FprA family A-type flavoprotein [Paenibacillus]MBY9080257.1 FprA family A-type flavoprotein [Paenibacillus sp. CGMCC 1.18879]MBY9083084.1 FprA family A-type flavoprotein [Paenibacillus sinensis]
MYCVQAIASGIYWVGGTDKRLERFENMFPLPNGVAYNSYLIMDDKTALMDTVDAAISAQFLENIEFVLEGRPLDYLVVNHMEPDHCANIEELLRRYPEMKLVGNKKTFQFMEQFYTFSEPDRYIIVKEGDELALGSRTLRFFMTPFVHWPEVMFSYEVSESILFSADAFGCFGSLSGNIFSDQTDFDGVYLEESRRYYSNIVGKYGAQVQTALKKLGKVDIKMICPLHGPVWRDNLDYIVGKYRQWSSYQPEKQGVVLVYASMYGNTENAMNLIAGKLSSRGVKDIRMYDVSKTHPSYIIADAWKFSHLVFGSPTYNLGLYHGMQALLHEMASLNLQNRKVSLVGNYTWANAAVDEMTDILQSMKKIEFVGEPFVIHSAIKPEQMADLDQLVDDICASLAAESAETAGAAV